MSTAPATHPKRQVMTKDEIGYIHASEYKRKRWQPLPATAPFSKIYDHYIKLHGNYKAQHGKITQQAQALKWLSRMVLDITELQERQALGIVGTASEAMKPYELLNMLISAVKYELSGRKLTDLDRHVIGLQIRRYEIGKEESENSAPADKGSEG